MPCGAAWLLCEPRRDSARRLRSVRRAAPPRHRQTLCHCAVMQVLACVACVFLCVRVQCVGMCSLSFCDTIRLLGFHDATRLATLHNSAMPGPLTLALVSISPPLVKLELVVAAAVSDAITPGAAELCARVSASPAGLAFRCDHPRCRSVGSGIASRAAAGGQATCSEGRVPAAAHRRRVVRAGRLGERTSRRPMAPRVCARQGRDRALPRHPHAQREALVRCARQAAPSRGVGGAAAHLAGDAPVAAPRGGPDAGRVRALDR